MQGGLNNIRKIENNVDYIVALFLNIANISINKDDNFKQGLDDLEVYFTSMGNNYRLVYDDFRDEYLLYHLNHLQNPSKAHKYHKQTTNLSLPSLIKYISSLHNPSKFTPNRKQSRMEKLVSSIK